jgi:DNA-binding response OmpR family regulator
MLILVVDDDHGLVNQIQDVLRKAEFDTIVAKDARAGLWRWRAANPDLVLLEARLPGLGGLEVCRRIKKGSSTPVVLMTVADDEHSVIRGFEVGADDYVVKPLNWSEVVLRIHAVLRRTSGIRSVAIAASLSEGPFILEPATLRVTRGDHSARLTPSEFRILSLLVRNAGRVVTFERLAADVWGEESWWGSAQDASILRNHICHVRKKLKMIEGEPGYIRAVHRTGYILTVSRSSDGVAPIAGEPLEQR